MAFCAIVSCTKKEGKPNVILIMADDMGYECLAVNGAIAYQTPTLDKMAKTGMRFTNVFSQPLCTPSRVKIMTGKHNFRNYEYFGYLNSNQKTFGNLMQEAGYKTCISGKWQLNGLSYDLPGHDDPTRPNKFGFDEYCLWQLHRPRKDGERYADPLIYKNGEKLEGLSEKYGPDIFADFVCQFIEKNATEPFFIYYPMVLVHDPFVPTPDLPEWRIKEKRYEKDSEYFKDMMAYTDKIVNKIQLTLKDHGIEDNTLLIFTADNGTHSSITTQTISGPYQGGKSFTTQRGIHVPFVVSWPNRISKSGDYDGIVDFGDFYPTLAEIAGINISNEIIDGTSFLKVLSGDYSPTKRTALIHYDPKWGKASQNRNRFSMTDQYKLYQDGIFFNYSKNIDEVKPIDSLTSSENGIKEKLQEMLDKAEMEFPWMEEPVEQ